MSKYNYFRVITVDGYGYPTEPQVTFGFLSESISLINRSGFTIEYSFDGRTTHGDMVPTDESVSMLFDNRIESKLWFRAVNGFGSVRVEAWGNWGR